MTCLEKLKIMRESILIETRLKAAEAEINRIRSDHKYLDPEILDVLCFPVKKQVEELRAQLLSNTHQMFLMLSEVEQDRFLEAVRLEEQRMRGECH